MELTSRQKNVLILSIMGIVLVVALLVVAQAYRVYLSTRVVSVLPVSESVVGGTLKGNMITAGRHTLTFRAKTSDGKMMTNSVTFTADTDPYAPPSSDSSSDPYSDPYFPPTPPPPTPSASPSPSAATGKPDLTASSIIVNGTLVAGQPLTMTATISNSGAVAVTTSTSTRFVFNHAEPSQVINYATAGPLGVNASTTVTSPSFTATAGTHNFQVCANLTGTVWGPPTESTTANNCTMKSVTVAAAALPDLIASSLSVSSTSIRVGQPLTMRATISNIGGGNAGPTSTRFDYLNTAVAQASTPGIPAKTSVLVSSTWTPSTAGTYLLRACANITGSLGSAVWGISESPSPTINPHNNCGAQTVMVAAPSPSPSPSSGAWKLDLAVRGVSVNGTRTAGQPLTMTATIDNIGTTVAPSTSTVFAFNYGEASQVINYATASPLGIGASTTVTSPPFTATTGQHTFSACANMRFSDHFFVDLPNEINTSNNCVSQTVMVAAPSPTQ